MGYLNTQEFADRINVHYTTVVNYEKKGIILPAKYDGMGRRMYTEEQVKKYWDGDYNPKKNKEVKSSEESI